MLCVVDDDCLILASCSAGCLDTKDQTDVAVEGGASVAPAEEEEQTRAEEEEEEEQTRAGAAAAAQSGAARKEAQWRAGSRKPVLGKAAKPPEVRPVRTGSQWAISSMR